MPNPPAVTFARRLEETRRLHARGDAANAARRYAELNRERPDNPAVLHGLGVALAQTGRFADGEAALRRAIVREPRAPEIRFDLAALFEAQARADEAERTLLDLVAVVPDHAAAWAAIAMYRKDAADPEGAGKAHAQAFRAAPESLDHALAAAASLPPEAAAGILVEALERHPDDRSLLQPLAEIFLRAERMDDAAQILELLARLEPDDARVRYLLGGAYARLGRFPDAAAALHESILRDEGDPDAWVGLANVRDAMRDPEGAAAAIGRAVDLRSDDLGLVGRRARLQQHGARADAARASLAELPDALRGSAEVRLLNGMLLPPILRSNEEVDALRGRWMETMADVEAHPTFVPEPWETIAISGYYLGYHGREDRPLMEALARATLASSPHLDYTAKDPSGSGGEKLRVGFLSAHMRLHSVGRVLIKLMGALDRERFDVVLFQLPDKLGGGQEWGEANADRTVRLKPDLATARAAVEAERPDVLIFCDLHLTPFVDALSFSRLAPVQATTWGHPGTGGRASIDYWLSCKDWEPEGNERLYTEELVRLASPPFVYTRPLPAERPRDRASFGLPAAARLYGSLQSIFKFHPDMDAIFGAILERDPKGRLVLISGPHYTYERQLLARFAKTFDPSRVDFIPTIPNKDYLAAVAACDVMLDPIHFAGANTTLEAFALGKPVVTLLGDQMRNRATGGFYRQMGVEGLVAENHAEYVDLALRLAEDPSFYREKRKAILDRNGVLYENRATVPDFERWLLSVRR